MGSVDDCFDKAMWESFFATLECELLNRRRFKTQVEARMAVFDFIVVQLSPPPLGARLSIADQLRKESSSRDWFPQANTVYRNG
jgi:putative transposase